MRLTVRLFTDRTKKLLDYYSQFHPSVLTIQQFIDFGSNLNASPKKSFIFLRKEIPVRLANIMKEIQLLPEQLINQPSVRQVEKLYEQSLLDLVGFEKADPESKEAFKKFNDVLDFMRKRQGTVVETMAMGVMEFKEQHAVESGGADDSQLNSRVQYFLDRFYMNRISIRMLLNQHLLLFADTQPDRKHIGCIDPNCDPLAIAQDAYENAKFLCNQYYSTDAPVCEFISTNAYETSKDAAAERITMTYIPSHLYQMLFELFKNSLRAVVECHQDADTVPKMKVLISKGREDVTIKLSDQGGGIRRSELDLLFNYMYSTAPRPSAVDINNMTPLAGFGYGLPLSRLYAKYFQGDLWLNSVDGYGTDAMISLKLFPCDASELLPVYNKTSSQKYTSARQIGDWSDSQQKGSTGSRGIGESSSSSSSSSTKSKKLGDKTPPTRELDE